MLVSIIIPVYRSKKYIERCIRSVFDQTYKDLEIIIVDDCGKDGSIDIIKRVMMEYPEVVSKVRFIYNEFNKGCAAARREGMKDATGQYIIQIDSDDYADSTMVEKLVNKAQKENADMVVCNYYHCNSERISMVKVSPPSSISEFVNQLLLGYLHAGAWNKLMRRSIIKDHNIYPVPGINMGDDMTILIQALSYMNRISYVPESLYFYNRNAEGSVSRTNYSIVNDIKLINLLQSFFDEHHDDHQIIKCFEMFKLGRLGRNLLYNDLKEVERYQEVFNVTDWKLVFNHKRLPIHYKLVVFFYLKNFMPGVRLIRRLIKIKK